MMNILELSTQLRELSDDYSQQRIIIDEYRLKRKYLLDTIDQVMNNQDDENAPQNTEEIVESNTVDNAMPETINKTSDIDKKGGDVENEK